MVAVICGYNCPAGAADMMFWVQQIHVEMLLLSLKAFLSTYLRNIRSQMDMTRYFYTIFIDFLI